MIEAYPNAWLGPALIAGIAVAALAIAAFFILRWGWRAWPLVLLVGLGLPMLVSMVAFFVVSQLDVGIDGSSNYSFEVGQLMYFVGLPAALAGFGGATAVRWKWPNLRRARGGSGK